MSEVVNFIPGVELARAILNPNASALDVASGVLSVVPGGGKIASLGVRAARGLFSRASSFLRSRKALNASKGGGNNLFRVVDDVELADIQKTGIFRSAAGTLDEGKQFVDNIGDAKALQLQFTKFFGGNQTIVGAQAPQSLLNSLIKRPFGDIPKGQAITVPLKDLPKVKPNL